MCATNLRLELRKRLIWYVDTPQNGRNHVGDAFPFAFNYGAREAQNTFITSSSFRQFPFRWKKLLVHLFRPLEKVFRNL